MIRKHEIENGILNQIQMIRYNMKIIFSGRFIWFLLSALLIFLFFAFQTVWNGRPVTEGTVYRLMIFPGMLLIFYPSVFGIQSDEDARMLEILFGIPNYRYKVWLVRLLMIYILVYMVVVLFLVVASFFIYRVGISEMAYQLMFPIIFMGSMAFMFSTVVRNGNGTAVLMVLIGVALIILLDSMERTLWNVFLNPFQIPDNFNEVFWQSLIVRNRIFLGTGTVVFMLYGLYNLQKREKFV